MHTRSPRRNHRREGYALFLVILLTGAALILATGLFHYASTTANLNHRHNEYHKAIAAAEAATEKVIARVNADYRDQGDGYVMGRLDFYRAMVPTAAEHPGCGDFLFEDLSSQDDRVEITYLPGSGFEVSSGNYAGLRGTKSKLRVVANAKARNSLISPVGSVYQDIELLRVPIFQFAIFYNVDLEFDNLPPMAVTGRVHCNTNVWVDPYMPLTFNSDVTSAGTINEFKMPGNPLPAGSGTITYNAAHDSHESTLNLPIGTNNSPAYVHDVIEVPPLAEDPYSSMGQQRYYNKADLIILIDNAGLTAKSGLRDFFATTIPYSQISSFVSTNITFYNKRELKWVRTTQIDIAQLVQWNANPTNNSLRPLLPQGDIRTLFVADLRPQTATYQPGVRLVNGDTLPPKGLTVATPNPLYIQGHYNAPAPHRGSTNTSATLPASVAADAVTILSTHWNDSNSDDSLPLRIALDTTVNAAILSGIVPTTASSYSGGVENFPRFLEEWTGRTLTYNGSMVAMFYSETATNRWRGIGVFYDIYNPPIRNWALDQNFLVESKLPPATPSMTILARGSWRMPAPYSTNVPAGF